MEKQFINNDPYAELGVSSKKTGVHKATKNLSKGLYPGAFCQIVPMSRNLPDSILNSYAQVIHSDGVGTKSNVAYLAMKEGVSEDFLYNLAQDAIVMNTDDMICVGITDDIYISNHIARNSNRVNDDALAINTLLCPYYRKYEETMDATIDKEKLFCGKYRLEDKLEGTSLTIAEAILSTTRTYLPVIRDILQDDIQVSGIDDYHNMKKKRKFKRIFAVLVLTSS